MSNLIPEKRMDKTGKLVTRHVRPPAASQTAPALPVAAIPTAPLRGLTEAPVKTQHRTHYRFIPPADYPDSYKDIAPRLGGSEHLHMGGFHATDYEVYGVLSVTDPGTALALLEYGSRSADEAEHTLRTLGLEHLLKDNSDLATGAMVRRIFPETYLRKATPDVLASEHALDYLQVVNMNVLENYSEMHTGVLNGTMRLEDIKSIGIDRIRNAGDWAAVKKVLTGLADGSAAYTAEEAGALIERYANAPRATMFQALLLAQRYGADVALELTPTAGLMSFADYLWSPIRNTDKDRCGSLLRYYRQVETSLAQHSGNKKTARGDNRVYLEDLIRFHDAGANPDQVASGSITINQIEAINTHGIAPSVAGGWL